MDAADEAADGQDADGQERGEQGQLGSGRMCGQRLFEAARER
ncbi:hypothetical protein [Streptomyces sp. NPDC041003]